MSRFADVEDRDPATGETIAVVPATQAPELAAAVARARAASAEWARVPLEARAEAVGAAGDALLERAEELADFVTREMGKPRAEALAEARGRARGMAAEAREVAESLAPESRSTAKAESRTVREPHGVVAAISPWNFPVGMPLELLVPALVAGNAVVFKPSEHVPLTGALLAEVLQQHLPDGVLELVQGAGDVGAALVDSDVDAVAFVGSRATGVRIMQAASRDLKRLVLELGGKDPLIVFEDADLDAAAECAVRHSLRNAGQVCCAVERVYVADAVADDFEARVLEKARGWNHGPGTEEGVELGPMVSAEQRAKVHDLVTDAVANGARLLLGGTLPDGPGSFYPATVLGDVRPPQRIARDETFGPVVSLARFDGSEAAAIELANDTPYGLGANVYTKDVERGVRVAAAIRSGQVGVNRYLTEGGPWVGQRQSGFGYLGGPDGHRQFTIPKTISVAKG